MNLFLMSRHSLLCLLTYELILRFKDQLIITIIMFIKRHKYNNKYSGVGHLLIIIARNVIILKNRSYFWCVINQI